MPARTMLLVLDSCDRDVATDLAANGAMPNLARLLGDAASLPTIAPPAGTFVSGIWPTLWTSRRPEHHGYTCWVDVDPTSYADRQTSPREVDGVPFWEVLTGAGLRSALLDVPHSWPSPDHNGVMICEWSGHDRHFGLDSWPSDEARRLVARHGLHPVNGTQHDRALQFAPCDWILGGPQRPRTGDETTALAELLVRGIETKTAASLEYLAEDDWDFFASVVGETHCSGHQLWYLHDPTHERFEPGLRERLGDPLADIYARSDTFLGAHLDAAGPETNVFVLLSHGMAPHHGGNHLLEFVLHRLAQHHDAGFAQGSTAVRAGKRVWDALPAGARRRTAGPLARAAGRRPAARSEPTDIVPPRAERPWFLFPNNDVVGAVRINLQGRERSGVVSADELDATIDWLSARLRELVHPTTGHPVVRDIMRGSDVFPMPVATDHFADLYFDWDMTDLVDTVYSPRIGVLHSGYTHVRSGDHLPHGLLLARGPGVRSVEAAGAGEAMPIVDLAPTIARTLGVELPAVDGRPHLGLLAGAAVR